MEGVSTVTGTYVPLNEPLQGQQEEVEEVERPTQGRRPVEEQVARREEELPPVKPSR